MHHLLLVGTEEGKVEAWDPRTKNKVGSLDCALHCIGQDDKYDDVFATTNSV